MDLPPTQDPEEGLAGSEDIALAGWLAEVESRLAGIDARLAVLETSLRPAVAEEVQGATAELRRAMTELGRRLVQDLPHELARHRDAIVAELRPPAPSAPPAVASDDDQATEAGEPATASVAGPGADDVDAGRRATRRRRRG